MLWLRLDEYIRRVKKIINQYKARLKNQPRLDVTRKAIWLFGKISNTLERPTSSPLPTSCDAELRAMNVLNIKIDVIIYWYMLRAMNVLNICWTVNEASFFINWELIKASSSGSVLHEGYQLKNPNSLKPLNNIQN